ncbi:Lrp/AsnC family transcriptional regulator [Candidatus Woesearchaeota archaeon]|nr:Lrp/AsnC family transcriptional regulator [Candidatus Woesearchaeota archaeon]
MVGRINHDTFEHSSRLDTKDKKILTMLADNARVPLTQLCKQVGLSRDAVDYRIKKLEKDGVILKFFPNLNYDKLGYYIFHIFLLIDEVDQKKKKELIGFLADHQNIYSVIEYNDRWDLEIAVIAKNLIEFDDIMMDIGVRFPQIIMEKDKVEIIKRYYTHFLPPLIKSRSKERKNISFDRKEPVVLDEKDYRLLRLLSEDCRASTYKLGERLKISSDAVLYRMKKMQDNEIIRNYTILTDISKMHYQWYTFSIEMKMFDREHEHRLGEFLQEHGEIIRAAKTLGGWDLLLYIIVRDVKEFHQIVMGLKHMFASVVKNYQTWVAYKEHSFKTMPEIVGNRKPL